MVFPFMMIYMTSSIGVSNGKAGLVIACFGAGSLLTAPFVGKLSDKVGSLLVMKSSLILSGIILILFSFIKNYYAILTVTLFWSIISEAFRPANLSLISNETKPEQRKTAFALNRLAINLGMSIGPVIGGILSSINFALLFYVDGITSIIAGIFLILLKVKPKSEIRDESIVLTNKEKKIANKKQQSILKNRNFFVFLFILIPVELVFFQFLGGLPLYLVGVLKFPTTTFGLLMAINTVLIILTEVPLNNAMANWDDSNSLALGAFLCGAGFGAMIVSNSIGFIAITIIVWTFGEMLFFPSSASYVAGISPENMRGEYMAYYQMSFSFSIMVGPWLGAVVLENFGHVILWSGAFIFALFSSAAFLLMKKNVLKPFEN